MQKSHPKLPFIYERAIRKDMSRGCPKEKGKEKERESKRERDSDNE